jgi:hypothetical protein
LFVSPHQIDWAPEGVSGLSWVRVWWVSPTAQTRPFQNSSGHVSSTQHIYGISINAR